MHCSFKIHISQQFTIKCSIITTDEQETPITIQENKEEYPICLEFTNKDIIICQETEHSISFMNEWLNSPKEYNYQSFTFQGEKYEAIPEVLFALIINEFKKKVTKKYIIDECQIQIPTNDYTFISRMKVSLESIDLKNIYINDDITFDYGNQGDLLETLLKKKEEYIQFQEKIEQMKEIIGEKEMEKIDLSQSGFSSQKLYQVGLKFTTKQKTEMKLYNLDNYCAFLASKYFENVEDHINLVFVAKRFRCNMEKFHFNPLSLNERTIQYFPNIETFHCYKKEDQYLSVGKIAKYVNWYGIGWYESQTKANDKDIEYKKLIYTKEDAKIDFEKERKNVEKKYNELREQNAIRNFGWGMNHNIPWELHIPEGIHEFEENCFSVNQTDNNWFYSNSSYSRNYNKVSIPSTMTHIPIDTFIHFDNLEEITIPLNKSRVIYGNKIFNNQRHFGQAFYLPDSIKKINGNVVEQLTSFEIPTFVTSLVDNCFYECDKLQKLIIPETVTDLPDKPFPDYNWNFHEITIPSSITRLKPSWFQNYQLTKITLPDTIVEIPDDIFNNNYALKEINIPSSTVKNEWIEHCTNLTKIILPESMVDFPENAFSKSINLKDINIPSKITSLNTDWLQNCFYITSLSFPKKCEIHGHFMFKYSEELKILTMPEDWNFDGDRMFRIKDGCLSTISLPLSLEKLNGENIQLSDFIKYPLPTNVTKLDDYCFDNCPKLEEIEGLKNIKEFGEGCLYNCPLLPKSLNKLIRKGEEKQMNLKENQIEQLEEWTGKKLSSILFDSNSDNYQVNSSVFNQRIKGKKQLLFIIEDEDDEKFGYYLSTSVEIPTKSWKKTDNDTFHFNIESNGRLSEMKKYEIKELRWGGYRTYTNDQPNLISMGNIHLMKQLQSESYCIQNDRFDYHKDKNALCGKEMNEEGNMIFSVKRILVIQMK